MKIGVLFPSRVDDPGEFLADARAMEAAAVDSLWVRDGADGLDPLLLLAAVAAVTGVVRLGLISHSGSQSAIGEQRRWETLRHLSRDRLVPDAERWQQVRAPADRQDWAKMLEEAEDAEGVIVPMDPRLLDILRHPDDAIDRSDLLLAQG
jgi:Luciferase-like monooxygenase